MSHFCLAMGVNVAGISNVDRDRDARVRQLPGGQ